MAARSTMADLITLLRTKVNDTDESIWTDDQLQTYLDMHRKRIRRERLTQDIDNQVYRSQYTLLEGDADTWTGAGDPTDVLNIWEDSGSDADEVTPDSWNLTDGTFIFDSEQDSTPYYLDCFTYDLHAAIAECLEQLAMDENKAKQWGRGGVNYTPYDLMQMAEYHRKRVGGKARLIR